MKRDTSRLPIPWSDVEPVRAVQWWAPAHIRFMDANFVVCKAFGSVMYDASPVEVECSIADDFEDDDDWYLADISLSNNIYVCASLFVYFVAIHSLSWDLSMPVLKILGPFLG